MLVDKGNAYQVQQTGGKGVMQNVKRLINRLVRWLRAAGLTEAQINDCVEYITK